MKTVKEEVDEWERAQKLKKSLSQKEWYQRHKEKIIDKQKEYYQENKEHIIEKSNEVVQCPLCHTMLKRKSLTHHKHTEKCKILRLFQIPYKNK